MPWLELSLRCHASEEARLEAALEDLGALSVSLLDAADADNERAILEPGVGELPLWPELRMLALFDEGMQPELLLHALEAWDPHLDLASAPRAHGIGIDWVEDVRGSGLSISNPNAPPPVKSMSVQELHDRIVAGAIDVIDVRPAEARAVAPFPQPHEVLDEDSHERLASLPKDLPLAFLCHHGNSSRQAAEHFRGLGFHDLYNVEGGIDAWAAEIDSNVPRY